VVDWELRRPEGTSASRDAERNSAEESMPLSKGVDPPGPEKQKSKDKGEGKEGTSPNGESAE